MSSYEQYKYQNIHHQKPPQLTKFNHTKHFSFSRSHKNTQKKHKTKKTTKKQIFHSETKRLISLQTKELSFTYEISSSDEWLCPTGAIAVLVDASEGAEDIDGVRETLGKSKTKEGVPLLEPLMLGVGGRERSTSVVSVLSCLSHFKGLNGSEK